MEQTTDTQNSLDGSQMRYAECKNPVSKGHILYGFILYSLLEMKNYGDGGQISGCQWLGMVGKRSGWLWV